jgi:transketolase
MSDQITTELAYANSLVEHGQKDNLVVLEADLAAANRTNLFRKKYPGRFYNIGIAEANMVGIAAGMATTGKIVFVHSFAMFASGRAFEQIRNFVAYPKLNVKIVGTHAGFSVERDGATHQSLEDIGIMRTIPNMKIVYPADAIETEAIVKSLITEEGPAYLRLERIPVKTINNYPGYQFKLGKGSVLTEGGDLTVITNGLMVQIVLEVAEQLLKESIKARVINMPTVKPIDQELIIQAAKETGAVVTVENHNIIGGLGSTVAEVLSENCAAAPLKRIGVNDSFGKSGTFTDIMAKYGLDVKGITAQIRELLKKK